MVIPSLPKRRNNSKYALYILDIQQYLSMIICFTKTNSKQIFQIEIYIGILRM